MESEYTGPTWLLRWHEVRARGFGNSWWRLRYELRKKLGRIRRPAPLDLTTPETALSLLREPPADVEALKAHVSAAAAAGRFFTDRAPLADYAAAVRGRCDAEATIAAAERVCEHRFEFLGQTFDFAGGEIDWHRDPVSGDSWPPLPWEQLDIRTDRRLGDIKFTWELNRHQFWPTLGRAYALTGDERYAAEWVAQFESWTRQNPAEIGVNWWSNLEHALRIVSWWTTAKLMLASGHVTGAVLGRIIAHLAAKARHIVADLDYSIVNMANNHLIGDAMGLAVLAMAIPELAESDGWLATAAPILWTEGEKQIYPDGSSFECAASYHRFVLHFYLLTLIAADLNGVEVPPAIRRRIEGMAAFVQAAMRPDGTLPQFGDWDDGLGYRLNDAPVHDFRPVLSTAAVLFDRADFAASAGAIDQETIWLLGPEAVDAFDALAARKEEAPTGNIAFADGGYFVQRSGAANLFVLNTPFTSHTHADLLSVDLALDGKPVLVDTGAYTYNGDWTWRTGFRTTRAHNTVVVDGRGQALAHRAFRFLFPPRARNNVFAGEGRFCFDGRHDGYRKLGLTHRRVVLAIDERTWLCLDALDGAGEHDADVVWNFAPDLAVEAAGGAVEARRGADLVLTLAATATAPIDPSIVRGQTDPPAGWFSAGYGVKEPTAQALFRAERAAAPLMVATVLAGGEPMRPTSVSRTGPAVNVMLESAAGQTHVQYLLLDPDARDGGRVEVGAITFPDGSSETLSAERLES